MQPQRRLLPDGDGVTLDPVQRREHGPRVEERQRTEGVEKRLGPLGGHRDLEIAAPGLADPPDGRIAAAVERDRGDLAQRGDAAVPGSEIGDLALVHPDAARPVAALPEPAALEARRDQPAAEGRHQPADPVHQRPGADRPPEPERDHDGPRQRLAPAPRGGGDLGSDEAAHGASSTGGSSSVRV